MSEWPWEEIDMYASQKTWIGKLINFSKENNIEIKIIHLENNRNKNRKNKEIIQEGIVGEDLQIFNHIRMTMKIKNLYEICDITGRNILPWAWECKQIDSEGKWSKEIARQSGKIERWKRMLGNIVIPGTNRLKKSIKQHTEWYLDITLKIISNKNNIKEI